MDFDLRARIQHDVDRRGLGPVAKELRVSRGGLASWLLGRASRGTDALIREAAKTRPQGPHAA